MVACYLTWCQVYEMVHKSLVVSEFVFVKLDSRATLLQSVFEDGI